MLRGRKSRAVRKNSCVRGGVRLERLKKGLTENGFGVLEITVRAYRRSPSASKSFSCKDGSFVGPSKSPQNRLAERRLDKSDSKTDNWQEWQPSGGLDAGKTCVPSRDARTWFATRWSNEAD